MKRILAFLAAAILAFPVAVLADEVGLNPTAEFTDCEEEADGTLWEFWDRLDDDEKEIGRAVMNAVIEGKGKYEKVWTGQSNDESMYKICTVLRDMFFLDRHTVFSYECLSDGSYSVYAHIPDLNESFHKMLDTKKAVMEYAKTIIPSEMSERETVECINDEVCRLIDYDYSQDVNIAWEEGYGNCMCYSTIFKWMCEAVGIQCVCETGMAVPAFSDTAEDHQYNSVRVNGKWLYIDVTWNDCLGRNDYFLSPELWEDHTVDIY